MGIKPGIYPRFKGSRYKIIGAAKHSESLEDFVVYQAMYGEKGLRTRPAKMFAELVEVNGRIVPRFEFIGEEETKNI